MDAQGFYRSLEERICQGDIFNDVPHLFLKDRPMIPQSLTFMSRKAGFLVHQLASTNQQIELGK